MENVFLLKHVTPEGRKFTVVVEEGMMAEAKQCIESICCVIDISARMGCTSAFNGCNEVDNDQPRKQWWLVVYILEENAYFESGYCVWMFNNKKLIEKLNNPEMTRCMTTGIETDEQCDRLARLMVSEIRDQVPRIDETLFDMANVHLPGEIDQVKH